jgi:threonine/homoserine efflux transporter RhtA
MRAFLLATAILLTFSAAPLIAIALERRSAVSTPVTVITLAAIACGLGLVTQDSGGASPTVSVGAALAILAGCFFGAYPFALDLAVPVPLSRLMMLAFGFSAILHVPLLFVKASGAWFPSIAVPFSTGTMGVGVAAASVSCGILLTYVPDTILASVRRKSDVSQVALAMLFSIEPSVAIPLAAFFLGQPLRFGLALGSIGVVVAVTAFAIHDSSSTR